MSEEEKKAIEVLKSKRASEQLMISGKMCVNILLNLIEKQQKELEQEKEKNIKLKEKLTYDKEKINEKLRIANDINNPLHYEKGFYMNDYQKIRLKGMKTKINEILKFYL